MNILVVDDDKPENLFPKGHVRAKTLNQGMALVTSPGLMWDEVWLDHDLGVIDGRVSDIMKLVQFLEEQEVAHGRKYPIKKIVICTNSPVGRENMIAALENTTYPYRVWSW